MHGFVCQPTRAMPTIEEEVYYYTTCLLYALFHNFARCVLFGKLLLTSNNYHDLDTVNPFNFAAL